MAHYDNIDWEGMRRRRRNKMLMWIFNTVLAGLTVWAILAWYDWKLLVILVGFVWMNNNELYLNGKFRR